MEKGQILLVVCVVIVFLLVLLKSANSGCSHGRIRTSSRRDGAIAINKTRIRSAWGLNSSDQYPHGNFVTRSRW